MNKSYKIASKIWQIEFDDSKASEVLHNQLDLYDKVDKVGSVPDIYVKINCSQDHSFIANNPRIHFEIENGFMFVFKRTKVLWEKLKNKLYIEIFFDNKKNVLTKWNNIQFHYPYQRFGQIFHELVISPTILMFADNVVVIHSSSVAFDDHGYAFTGFGGSGKTSISTSLILEKDYKFVADDISFLHANGRLYSNLEYTKIYCYNVKQNPPLKKKMMDGRNIFDKIQWILKQKIPPYSVRRSVNPKEFFDNKIAESVSLNSVYNLFHCDCKEVKIEKFSKEKTAEMNFEMIKSEFNILFRHLQWHRINRIALGKQPLVSQEKIRDKYNRIQEVALRNAEIFILKIPIDKQINNYKDLGENFPIG